MTPERLAEIAAQAYRHMTPWRAKQFRETLDRADALLVTRGDAFVLGSVVFETAEILALASAPGTQRQGLARRALNGFLAEAAERGATRVILEVSAQNEPAICLYESTGFAVIGRRKAYYPQASGPAVDALVMECPEIGPS